MVAVVISSLVEYMGRLTVSGLSKRPRGAAAARGAGARAVENPVEKLWRT